jgi:carnitine 3-dehydrogenase
MYYTVENHIRHLGEAKVGESLYVTAQVLEADDKRLHVFQRMFRARDDKLIAMADQMYLHVDTAAAKAAAADPKVREKAGQLLRAQAALPRPAEAGRAVGFGRNTGS